MRASAFSLETGPAVRSVAAADTSGARARLCLPEVGSLARVFHGPDRVKQTPKCGRAHILQLSILGDFGVGGVKLPLDVERGTALSYQDAVQRADVSALAVVLLERSEALVGAAEPAGEGLHCRWCGRVPFGLGLGGERLEHLKSTPDGVGEPGAIHPVLAAFQIVSAVFLQANRGAGATSNRRARQHGKSEPEANVQGARRGTAIRWARDGHGAEAFSSSAPKDCASFCGPTR